MICSFLKRFALALCVVGLPFVGAKADLDIIDGKSAAAVIFDFTCFTTKHCTAHVNINSAGTEIFTAAAPGQVTGANGTFPATQSGTWTVQPGNTANTTPWLTKPHDGTNPLFTNTNPGYVSGIGATAGTAPTTFSPIGALTSGATGGFNQPIRQCDLNAKYDASTTGSTTLVTGVASRKVYICRVIMATGGTATNVKLREGSDANCATNGADLTPAYQLVANDKIGWGSSFYDGLVVSTNAYYVCINASAANAVQAQIWYTIQ